MNSGTEQGEIEIFGGELRKCSREDVGEACVDTEKVGETGTKCLVRGVKSVFQMLVHVRGRGRRGGDSLRCDRQQASGLSAEGC